ncbi:hypothetical protein PGT21_018918 [Puccinia graminis f. sp. tritici]|uniref:Clathrin/coatomer adaptor adaptin-like N-terminal domain-containing protein n=1 Tax=Puccinia graminis f. sp. tritici TaxID=56615 RepID=A0A5B0N4H8_PUCGR|nr:hypothetical protein PGT21_018918 [Puccinia graminis f. sp. tritici]
MPTEMRGLNQYIADLRACRVRELEEKRINKEMANIRQKFKDGNLDGYSKKKYLAKIVFTYILGYPVDVGHMEAVNLISSPKYSEKQIVLNGSFYSFDDLLKSSNCGILDRRLTHDLPSLFPFVPGLSGLDSVDARKFGLGSTGYQLNPERFGRT